MDAEDGYLVRLQRDEAKSFFGCRTDQSRVEFLQELVQAGDTETLSCHGIWAGLHDVLSAAEDDATALSQCLLGGRNMQHGEDHLVLMVRPDVVRSVAEQGIALEEADFRSRWNATNDQTQADFAWSIMQAIIQLYDRASAAGSAMVFLAKRR